MKKEMSLLQTTASAGEYLAPRVKVVEVKTRRVMCLSGDPENTYGGYSNSEQEGS